MNADDAQTAVKIDGHAAAARDAQTLDELRDALNGFLRVCPGGTRFAKLELAQRGTDIFRLATFGGAKPAVDDVVWSHDATRMLIYNHDEARFAIVDRKQAE